MLLSFVDDRRDGFVPAYPVNLAAFPVSKFSSSGGGESKPLSTTDCRLEEVFEPDVLDRRRGVLRMADGGALPKMKPPKLIPRDALDRSLRLRLSSLSEPDVLEAFSVSLLSSTSCVCELTMIG